MQKVTTNGIELNLHQNGIIYTQCRINNSSKCSNCYGPSAFGIPLFVECVICNGGYYNLGKISERTPYILHMLYKALSTESKLNFCFVWKFASAWKSTSHCKLFEVM